MNEEDKIKCPVESLHRGLGILDLLFGSGEKGLSLAEISDQIGLKRTTVHNLLKTLVYSGYAVKIGEGRYCIGWRVRRMCDYEILSQMPGHRMDRLTEALRELTEDTGEALVLAVCVNGRRRVIARTTSGQAVEVNAQALAQPERSIWSLETGLVLAAYSSPEEYVEILAANGRPPEHEGGRFLEELLSGIRSGGCASIPNDSIFALAVPVLGEDGRLLAALGINQPMYRHRASDDWKFFQQLQAGARRLSRLWNE